MSVKWKTVEPHNLGSMIQAKRPVYILNTSLFPNGNKGTVVINFVDGTRKRHFTVPDTFIPLCITDSIPAQELANSADFLDLLRKRIITIVDSDQAQDYLGTKEAVEEYESIVLSAHSSKARGVDLETAVKRTFSSAPQLTAEVEENVTTADINNKVRASVEDLAAGSITAREFLANCKRHADGFTEVDLHYIKESVRDLEVQRWVEARILDKSSDIKSGSVKKAAAAAPKKGALASSLAAKKKNSRKDDDDDAPSSPEEEAELQRGMAAAMANQAVDGRSKVPEMVDKLLKGKK